jgi:hypothetical protein
MNAAERLFNRLPASHNEIDEIATDVARLVLTGKLAEKEARWYLASFIYNSNIPNNVVKRSERDAVGTGKRLPQQVFVDAVDYVRTQLTVLIAGENAKLNLGELAAGKSLCGWSSKIISGPRAFPKKDYDRRTHQLREFPVNADTISNLTNIRSLESFNVAPIEYIDDARDDIVDEYLLLSKGQREWELLSLSAEHICAISGVSAPRRAVNTRNRVSLLRRAESELTAARDDLYEYLDCGVENPHTLSTLFTNLTPRQIEDIIGLDPMASQMLARSALTPIPPPRSSVVKLLGRVIRDEVGDQQVVTCLTSAYTNVVSEVVGSEFTRNNAARAIKTKERRRQDFANWNGAVKNLVKSGYYGFGSTPDEVLVDLSGRTRRIAVERALRMSA